MNKTLYIEKYNEALTVIAKGDYERARQLLVEAEAALPHTPLVSKILGSIELLSGYPHLAVARWSRFSLDELGLPEERLLWAKSLLPEYDVIYGLYHNALDLIKQDDYEGAYTEFSNLIALADKFALPLPVYRGYLMLMSRAGEYDRVNQEILRAPRYVQQSVYIQRLQNRLEAEKNRAKFQGNRKQFKFALTASIMLLVGSLCTIYLMNDKTRQIADTVAVVETNEAQQQVQSHKNEDADQKEKIGALTDQLQSLEKLNSTILNHLQSAEKQLATQETMFDILGIDEEELRLKSANRSYNNGYRLFEAGKYEQALKAFQDSDAFELKTYFADDNLYYWAQSLKNMGREEEASKLYDRFLSETDPNYTQSPLLDDILLAKAEYLLNLGSKSEAKPLLQRIINEHQGEWTAKRAQQLLKSNP